MRAGTAQACWARVGGIVHRESTKPMRLPIDGIDLHWGEVPVDLTFSYGAVGAFCFTLVGVRSGGCTGWGEVLVHSGAGTPRRLAALVGQDASALDALIPPDPADERERIFFEAVSIALYDLVGQCAKLPLHVLLGGRRRDRVPLMPCLFPRTPEDARASAETFLAGGFRHLKVKLVGDLDEDRARVRAVRTVAPDDVPLQGDANEGYDTPSKAERAVRVLGDAGLDLFEDPLRGDVAAYRELTAACRGSRARVMVDALARHTADLAAVLRQEAADAVNIHPDQPGSLSRAVQHARLAQAFAVPVHIGGTGYTAVGSAAYQHLAAVATDGPCGELGGVFDHHMPASLVQAPLPMADGCVAIPDTPGLGVTIDQQTLMRFEQGRRSL